MRIGNSFDYTQINNDYASLRIREQLSQVKAPEDKASESAAQVQDPSYAASSEEAAVKRERLLGLEDVSLTFNKNDDFELIGKTSDITDLDIEKAVSVSKRDDILNQYKAAETALPVYAGEEGTVIAK